MSDLAGWLCQKGYIASLVVSPPQIEYLRTLPRPKHPILDFKTLHPISWQPKDEAKQGEDIKVNSQFSTGLISSLNRYRDYLQSQNTSPAIILLAVYWMLQMLRFQWLWRRRVPKLKCQVTFIWGDNAGCVNGQLQDMLKASGARLVHLPVALMEQDLIACLRVKPGPFRLNQHSTWISKCLASSFPNQLYDYKGYRLYYYHPTEILAMYLLRRLPVNPWVLGGVRADYVVLQDSYQLDYWQSKGMDIKKGRVVGDLSLMNLHTGVGRLVSGFPELFEQRIPLILINMPNLIEHNTFNDWELFWKEVDKMLSPFTNMSVELVVNLHPKCVMNKYAWLKERYACRVTQGDIAAWIAMADLYVSACSTTEITASDMSVPVFDIGTIYGFESSVLNKMPYIRFFSTYIDYAQNIEDWRNHIDDVPRRFLYEKDDLRMQYSNPFEKLMHLIENELLEHGFAHDG